ncbi:MAG: DUF2845 domain-containing protein [Immundisolibacter sp.]|uniref:DUF2845 domain-containing protein n=2 Tax=Immundisolibacter sp. TaxID=1934948 RepID=UPI003D15289B
MKLWPIALTLAGLAYSHGAAAGIRCGSKLIDVGDFSAYVLERCGEPKSRQVISGSIGADSPVIEQWVYDFGSRKPLRILTIVGGRVTRIEDSGRSR